MRPAAARRWVGALMTVPLAFVASACNSILDNTSGSLAQEEAGTGTADVQPMPMEDAMTPAAMMADADAARVDAAPAPMTDGGTGCPAGQKTCDGICVSVTDPLYGCGASGCNACLATRGTSTCVSGKCAVGTCDPGYSDCNKNPSDGCETDLSSATTCGTCNGVCGAVAPNCTPVGPGFQCATGCPNDAPLLCGKQCSDPMTSVAHCGNCNVTCPAVAHGTASCTGGACGYTCDPQFHACAGNTCARNTDPTACGPTCMVCPKPPSAVPLCQGSACAFACVAGTADCDAMTANGCEATLASDPKNCGACGVVCQSTCTKGKCDAPPPSDAGSGNGEAGAEGGADGG